MNQEADEMVASGEIPDPYLRTRDPETLVAIPDPRTMKVLLRTGGPIIWWRGL